MYTTSVKPALSGFRDKHAVEARAGEFHANNQLAVITAGLDVHDAALRQKFLLFAGGACSNGDADLELHAAIKGIACGESGAAPANIFTRSAFFKRESRTVLAT